MTRLTMMLLSLTTVWVPLMGVENTTAKAERKPHLSGDVQFYVDPNTNAGKQAKQWKASRAEDAALMEELAKVPTCFWMGGGDIQRMVKQRLSQCQKQKALPVFVMYNIPDRDAGNFSKGGEASAKDYLAWIGKFAEAVGTEPAVAIFEPDAVGLMDRCPADKKAERYAMMASAVETLAKSGSVDVYIDAGHSAWMKPPDAAKRLQQAGIEKARGFSLNVSNFQSTEDLLAYGKKLSALIGNKHFVIDTARNGNGPLPKAQDKDGMGWCNPPGRAVGPRPSAKTGEPLCDAFLWVKPPGESDGEFRGAPKAGQWWPEYALELMKNAKAGAAKETKH